MTAGETTYLAVLASGMSVEVTASGFETLRGQIADPERRYELHLVGEDGPYVVPAQIVAFECRRDESAGRASVATAREELRQTVTLSEMELPTVD